MIFEKLYEAYWQKHALLRLKCPANVHYFWKIHGPRWGAVEVEAITAPLVQDWFDGLAIKSKSSAVRALNQLSAIVNWGIRRGHIACGNPCRSVEKLKLHSRERFLMPDEMIRFKRSLEQAPQDTQDIFWLCLLTGARRGNVLSMEWSEVDTTLALWRIPPEKHKNGESHLAPLTGPAVAILARRRQASSGPWVFPGDGSTGHLVEPKRSWKTLVKRAGITNLRIHDLRRTFGSYLAINGESPYIIGRALGHIDPRSTAVYARLHIEPIRQAVVNAQAAYFHR